MTFLKLAILPAPFALIAAALEDVITTPATQIAALAAGVAGLVYLWRTLGRPAAELVHRMLTAYKHLEQLHPFVEQTQGRLDALEDTASANEDRLEAITRHLNIPRRVGERRSA